MQISFNFDTSIPSDVAALTSVLASLDRAMAQTAPTEVRSEPMPPAPAAPEPAAEAPAEKPKRGRKPKAEPAEPAEPDEVRSGEEWVGAAQAETAEPAAPAEPPKAVSLDEVRAALQQFTAAKGVPAGIELLKKFNAGRISELAAEHYTAFVAECAL